MQFQASSYFKAEGGLKEGAAHVATEEWIGVMQPRAGEC